MKNGCIFVLSKRNDMILYNETTTNGKLTLMSEMNLVGAGIKKLSSTAITTFEGNLLKGLNEYAVTKKAFEKIKSSHNLTRTCF